jgi:hypothetical protein
VDPNDDDHVLTLRKHGYRRTRLSGSDVQTRLLFRSACSLRLFSFSSIYVCDAETSLYARTYILMNSAL